MHEPTDERADEPLGMLLLRLGDIYDRLLRASLPDPELTRRQIQLLQIVWRDGPIAQKELAERLGDAKLSLPKMLLSLEGRGYVEKIVNPSDGRSRLVAVTDKGNALRERCSRILFEAEEAASPKSITGDLKQCEKALGELEEALGGGR